jgi:NAD(P)-dependent dehydrogenase (short-subunit alcohol dehydrogenase family)
VLTPLTEAALQHPVTGDLIRQYPIPLDRWGEKEEIAEAVWFLLSPQSSWTTGTILFVDGGTDALLNPGRI